MSLLKGIFHLPTSDQRVQAGLNDYPFYCAGTPFDS